MDSAKELGRMIGQIASDQQRLQENVYPDDPGAQLQLIFREKIAFLEEGSILKTDYSPYAFIIDHPVQGYIDSSTLKLDIAYTTLREDLVSYYSFESTLNDIHGSYNGTNSGVSFATSPSKLGTYSARFDGSDNFTTAAAQTNSLSAGTIAMWVIVDGLLVNYNLFGKDSANFRAQFGSGGVAPTDRIGFAVDSGFVDSSDYTGAGTVSPTNWTHYIFAWDGTNKYIVINGVVRLVRAETGATPASGDLYFGHNSVNTNERLVGNVEGVGIWNRILSGIAGKSVGQTVTDEALELYSAGSGVDYPFVTRTLLQAW